MFKLYKNNLEIKYSKKIKDIKFRSKENGWRNQTPIIEFFDNTKIEENSYYNAFVKEMINRPSCYSCVFASKSRITDFTIADFWGIENIRPNLNSKEGISLLTVNSINGEKIFEKIKSDMYVEAVNIDIAARYNHFHNVNVHKNRDRFFSELSNDTINESNIINKLNKYTKVSLIKRVYRKSKRVIKKIIKKH